MHAAKISRSGRLKVAMRLLAAAGDEGLTTLQMVLRSECRIVAVNSVIAELRANGAEIGCAVEVGEDGKRRFRYTLVKAPEGWNG